MLEGAFYRLAPCLSPSVYLKNYTYTGLDTKQIFYCILNTVLNIVL